ncbi:phage tail tape measure protein, partial [Vibrio anguillarum]|nr:phage tail tape measure protein [Vibrio anguillarum]
WIKADQQKLKTVAENSDEVLTLDELALERRKYKAELAIALAEIEEFQLLSERLPSQKSSLLKLSEETRERSVRYLAKINVLNHVLNFSNCGEVKC